MYESAKDEYIHIHIRKAYKRKKVIIHVSNTSALANLI